MKTYYDKPEEPYQLFVKLPNGTLKEQKHYACAHCRVILPDKEAALNCCKQDHCATCGGPTNKYWKECQICRDQRRMDAAVVVEDYEGHLCTDDQFYGDMGEYLDATEPGEEDEFLYCCTVRRLKDEDAGTIVDNTLENLVSDYHEDAFDALVCVDELESAVKAWLSKQTIETWFQDQKRKVKVPVSVEVRVRE